MVARSGNFNTDDKQSFVNNENGDVSRRITLSGGDAFGRIQVAEPRTLYEFSHYADKMPDTWDEALTGSATSVKDTNTSAIKLSTTTASGDKAIRKSFRNIEYIRAKSQLVQVTAVIGEGKENLLKRWGTYDDNNGPYLEQLGTEFAVVVRSKCTGSVVNTRVVQADFNLDKLDGTGHSGITLDLTKYQLFEISYTYLGTNVVRFGVLIDGVRIYFHQFNFANESALPWAQYAIFPFRYEIENTGTVASASDMFINCGAIISEGGDDLGFNHIEVVDTGVAAIAVTTTPILAAGAKIRDGFQHLSIRPLGFTLTPASGTTIVYYRVLLNPTIVTPVWGNIGHIAAGLASHVSYSGGQKIASGYLNLGSGGGGGGASSKGVPTSQDIILTGVHLGNSIANESDIIALEVRTVTGSGAIHFVGQLKEFI